MDSKTNQQMAVCVMVGGKSTRMGQPKEHVMIPALGMTFLDKVCREIDQCTGTAITGRYLSTRRGQKIERFGYVPVQDQYEETGPMGGMYSVLSKAFEDGYAAVLFLACDMIHMEAAELQSICASYQGEDILFARTQNCFVQPFGSVYKTAIAGELKKKIDAGDYRLRSLQNTGLSIHYYDSDNPVMFDNINESSDLSRICHGLSAIVL